MPIEIDPNGDPWTGGGDPFGGQDLTALWSYVSGLAEALTWFAGTMWYWVRWLAAAIGGFGVRAGRFLKHIWTGGLKVFLGHAWETIRKSHAWQELRHGHILAFLRELRKLLDTLYLNHIRPILVLLQQIRLFLQLLRALHINIGAELDRVLANIENKIAGTFLQIRAVLNTAVDLLNILVDAENLLRRPHLLLSLRRIVAALSVILTRRPLGYWFPSPRGSAAGYQSPVAFDPANPTAYNVAPASAFLGFNDGIQNAPPIDIGYTISVDAVDKIDALDFFEDSLWSGPACPDAALCLDAALRQLQNASLNG